jgi:hypothetical protein
MDYRAVKVSRACLRAFVSSAVVLSGLIAAPVAQAQAPIEGVWAITGTPRDCATGAVLGAPVRALLTFHQGGTASESVALLLAQPGQRSSGHGVWTQTGGATFVGRVATMIQFDSPVFQAGWTVETQTITMTNANNFNSVGDVLLYDINRQFLRRICSSRVGERFR